MSSEYLVVIEGKCDDASSSVESVFSLVCKRVPPYQIEQAFEVFGEEVERRLASILDRYADLFLAMEGFSAEHAVLTFRWSGYGYGEGFLEDMLPLLKAIGLQSLAGRAVGDEGLYCCRMVDGEVECEYIDE